MEDKIRRTTPYPAIPVKNIIEEVAGVKTFVLSNDGGIQYQPGQFITLVAYHNDIEERRSYSFSSCPGIDEPAITVKRVDNGFMSRYLIDDVQAGDQLHSIGTAGMFVLPADIARYKQLFLFAAGVGVTPVYSIIKAALKEHPHLLVTLVYSNSNVESTVFYDELKKQEAENSRLNIVWLFSNAKDLSKARLSKWMMPELLRKNNIAPKEETLYYLCGPFPYMRMVAWALEEQNVPSDNIKKENFDTKLPVFKVKPSDILPHKVTLLTQGQSYEYIAEYPETILSAARKAGVDLPFSCNTGKCGTCVAKCISGEVWHSYNEVLTDADMDKGLILTCTGHPINGDVAISYP